MCDRFSKRRQWLDDSDMVGSVVQRRKSPIAAEMTKQSKPNERAMEDFVIEAVSLVYMSR